MLSGVVASARKEDNWLANVIGATIYPMLPFTRTFQFRQLLMRHCTKLSMRKFLVSVLTVVLVAPLVACGFVHDEALIGPYRLIAIDTPEQMNICYTIETGDCVRRIPPPVFSVGWNEHFIVAKQHPSNNKEVTNYYILEMAHDDKYADPDASVTGPLTETAFSEKAAGLGLPPFTETIEALK